jgi:hypothetical protein
MGDPPARASEEAARISDVEQAAYFRGMLTVEETQVAGTVSEMRQLLDRHRQAGDRIEANRLQILLREHERELGEIRWLLTRLNQRFTPEASTD